MALSPNPKPSHPANCLFVYKYLKGLPSLGLHNTLRCVGAASQAKPSLNLGGVGGTGGLRDALQLRAYC